MREVQWKKVVTPWLKVTSQRKKRGVCIIPCVPRSCVACYTLSTGAVCNFQMCTQYRGASKSCQHCMKKGTERELNAQFFAMFRGSNSPVFRSGTTSRAVAERTVSHPQCRSTIPQGLGFFSLYFLFLPFCGSLPNSSFLVAQRYQGHASQQSWTVCDTQL